MSGTKVGTMAGPLLLAATLSLAGVDVHIYVPTGPPAFAVEIRPAPPAAGYVWVPGYHRWEGGVYVWEHGRWERPPRGRSRWIVGQWRHHPRNGWYWTAGYWR